MRGFGYILSNQNFPYPRTFFSLCDPRTGCLSRARDRAMTVSRHHMTWLRPKNTSHVMLPGHGHLVSAFPRIVWVSSY